MKHFFQFMACFCIVYNVSAMNHNEKKYPKRSFNQVLQSQSVHSAKLPASKKRKIMTKLDCEKFLQSLMDN